MRASLANSHHQGAADSVVLGPLPTLRRKFVGVNHGETQMGVWLGLMMVNDH